MVCAEGRTRSYATCIQEMDELLSIRLSAETSGREVTTMAMAMARDTIEHTAAYARGDGNGGSCLLGRRRTEGVLSIDRTRYL